MKFEDLTNEQIEKAKACTTEEERIAFLKEYSIEIPDDMLDEISGGAKRYHKSQTCTECPAAGERTNGHHKWRKTGQQRPGNYFGNVWKDDEYRCDYCGALKWCW